MTAPRYQIVLVQPEGFIHVEALREIMEAFQEGFRDLGHEVPIRINGADEGAIPLLFGGQHLMPNAAAVLPPETIFYNAEQLAPGYPWAIERYMALLARYEAWDFSARNVERLSRRARTHALRHVPIPYARTLTRIKPAGEDIDLLFVGRLNDRRRTVLERAADAGLKVHAVVGKYGSERDALIARSKAVVNVHFAERGAFESARIVFLLANRKALICEGGEDDDVEEDLRGGMLLARYDELADACVSVARDEALRLHLAERGYAAVRAPERSAARILARTLRIPAG
jgi:hypothetical protein